MKKVITRIKYAWLMLTSKQFRFLLTGALSLAYKVACHGGIDGASDTLLLIGKWEDILKVR